MYRLKSTVLTPKVSVYIYVKIDHLKPIINLFIHYRLCRTIWNGFARSDQTNNLDIVGHLSNNSFVGRYMKYLYFTYFLKIISSKFNFWWYDMIFFFFFNFQNQSSKISFFSSHKLKNDNNNMNTFEHILSLPILL